MELVPLFRSVDGDRLKGKALCGIIRTGIFHHHRLAESRLYFSASRRSEFSLHLRKVKSGAWTARLTAVQGFLSGQMSRLYFAGRQRPSGPRWCAARAAAGDRGWRPVDGPRRPASRAALTWLPADDDTPAGWLPEGVGKGNNSASCRPRHAPVRSSASLMERVTWPSSRATRCVVRADSCSGRLRSCSR